MDSGLVWRFSFWSTCAIGVFCYLRGREFGFYGDDVDEWSCGWNWGWLLRAIGRAVELRMRLKLEWKIFEFYACYLLREGWGGGVQ